jgi:aspartate-semialdehyde dehydrogenase
VLALEEAYAKTETPVVSNNSAARHIVDVPMIIPEVNPEHTAVITAQKVRLGTEYGFIAVKPNCSIQSYVPALDPLREFGLKHVCVCTYQAISGAGKTFDTWPEMVTTHFSLYALPLSFLSALFSQTFIPSSTQSCPN